MCKYWTCIYFSCINSDEQRGNCYSIFTATWKTPMNQVHSSFLDHLCNKAVESKLQIKSLHWTTRFEYLAGCRFIFSSSLLNQTKCSTQLLYWNTINLIMYNDDHVTTVRSANQYDSDFLRAEVFIQLRKTLCLLFSLLPLLPSSLLIILLLSLSVLSLLLPSFQFNFSFPLLSCSCSQRLGYSWST